MWWPGKGPVGFWLVRRRGHLGLGLLGLLGQEDSLDVGEDATQSDGHTGEQLVQIRYGLVMGRCLVWSDRPLKVQLRPRIFDFFYVVSLFFHSNIGSLRAIAKYWRICNVMAATCSIFSGVLLPVA